MTGTQLIEPDSERTATTGEYFLIRRVPRQQDDQLSISEPIPRPDDAIFVLYFHGHIGAETSTIGLDFLSINLADRSPTTPYWLENAKELDERGDDIAAMDLVFDRVDNLLLRGDFSSVDNLLRVIDVSRYSEDLLLTILTATLAAKDKLRERTAYFQQVHETLTHRGIDADRVLVGLL